MPEFSFVFDNGNRNWRNDDKINYMFLRSTMFHFDNVLSIRGYVFLNDVLDALGIRKIQEGQNYGWVYEKREQERIEIVASFFHATDQSTLLTFLAEDVSDSALPLYKAPNFEKSPVGNS